MNTFFDFISLIKNELISLAEVVPAEVTITIGAALTFIIVLGMLRIVALVEDTIPFV